MPPTILVVDDDPQLRHALVHALSDAGYEVEQASEQIATQPPDAILSDLRMPHLDGIGLATVLAPHTPPIPIIVMSGDPLPTGCALPYLRKPFGLDEVFTLMARTMPTPVASLALAGLGAV